MGSLSSMAMMKRTPLLPNSRRCCLFFLLSFETGWFGCRVIFFCRKRPRVKLMCDIYWLVETWVLSRRGVRANEELVVHMNESGAEKTQKVTRSLLQPSVVLIITFKLNYKHENDSLTHSVTDLLIHSVTQIKTMLWICKVNNETIGDLSKNCFRF